MKVAEDKGNEMKMQTKESEKEGYKTKRERGKTFKEIKNNGEKMIIMIIYIYIFENAYVWSVLEINIMQGGSVEPITLS